jgi:hypothetical protein
MSNSYEIRDHDHGLGKVLWLKQAWEPHFKSIMENEGISAVRFSALGSIKELDLSVMTEMPFLRGLEIYDWEVTDARIVEELPNLEVLGLQIKRTKPIDFSKLPKLRVALLIWCKGLEGVLSSSGIEYLNISNFPMEDLQSLSRLQSLRRLSLTSRKLKSLSGIADLQSLEELDLYDCRALEDDDGLGSLQNLKRIEIDACNKLKTKYAEQHGVE